MTFCFRAVVVTAACLALAQPAIAKGRDDDRHGPKTKFENNQEHYKYEYRDGHCRYKYEYKYRTGKTKVDQKGDCSAIAFPRPVSRGEPLPRAIPPEPQARTIECNREVLGAVLGGAIGAAVGSKVGDREDRPITTVGGAVIGAVVGGAIGKSMDDADQACAAQALEYANLKQTVIWHNKARATSYTVVPLGIAPAAKGQECRRFELRSATAMQQQSTPGIACRQPDGSWRRTI
jgi:surface antigen